jgi:hypothetical protein
MQKIRVSLRSHFIATDCVSVFTNRSLGQTLANVFVVLATVLANWKIDSTLTSQLCFFLNDAYSPPEISTPTEKFLRVCKILYGLKCLCESFGFNAHISRLSVGMYHVLLAELIRTHKRKEVPFRVFFCHIIFCFVIIFIFGALRLAYYTNRHKL